MTVSLPMPGPLRPGRFIQRPNRLTVNVVVEPDEVVVSAALPNHGPMQDILRPNHRVWVRPDPWTVVIAQGPHQNLICYDRSLSKSLMHVALEHELLEEMAGWNLVRTDVPISRSRMDFLLETVAGDEMLLDIKEVTLVSNRVAFFPAAPNAHAVQQLHALIRAASDRGCHAAVMFVVQRNDADIVRPAPAIDPEFAQALLTAQAAGVQLMARRLQVTLEEALLGVRLPVEPLPVPG